MLQALWKNDFLQGTAAAENPRFQSGDPFRKFYFLKMFRVQKSPLFYDHYLVRNLDALQRRFHKSVFIYSLQAGRQLYSFDPAPVESSPRDAADALRQNHSCYMRAEGKRLYAYTPHAFRHLHFTARSLIRDQIALSVCMEHMTIDPQNRVRVVRIFFID